EVEETHEQPVINKTAEIIEEVVLRKETSDRVETINDSVRRQEVDIDHASTDPLGADRLTGNRTVADPLLESTRQARADDSRPVTPGSEPA
ncbi:MAG TPA: stress response protein ysnf, partial [Pantoea sp.]|nr:stress response protein ysnf [Pantoea sp.]